MATTSSKYTVPLEVLLLPGQPITSGYSETIGPAVPVAGDVGFPVFVTSDRLWSGIRLAWDLTTLGYNEVRIVRKTRDYAYSLFDGLTVYEGSSAQGYFDDTTAVGLETFYYTLWFRDGDPEPWDTRYWLKSYDVALAHNLDSVRELLWKLLPSMYRQNEADRDNSEDMNLHVNQVIAPVVREIEGLTEFFPTLLDVDETPGPNLESIARYVGLIPNLELTYTQQREEIKGAVESYKKKGLKATLERMARAISGLVAQVVDWNQHLLITNWVGKTRMVADPLLGFNSLLPGDSSFRRLDITGGQQFDTATYGVYLTVPLNKSVNERTVRKLYRSLGNFAPVYMEMDLQLIQEVPPTEQFGSITESWWMEIDDTAVEDFTPQTFLTRNTLGSTSNTSGIVRLENWPGEEGSEEVT